MRVWLHSLFCGYLFIFYTIFYRPIGLELMCIKCYLSKSVFHLKVLELTPTKLWSIVSNYCVVYRGASKDKSAPSFYSGNHSGQITSKALFKSFFFSYFAHLQRLSALLDVVSAKCFHAGYLFLFSICYVWCSGTTQNLGYLKKACITHRQVPTTAAQQAIHFCSAPL